MAEKHFAQRNFLPRALAFLGGFLLAGLWASCKTPGAPPPAEYKAPPPPAAPSPPAPDPRGALTFDRAAAEDITRISLYFNLNIENPRDAGASGTIEAWRVMINGAPVEAAVSNAGAELSWGEKDFALRPLEEEALPLRVDIHPEELARQGFSLEDENELTVITDLGFAFSEGPPARISARGGARFPRIQRPVFKITDIAVMKAGLINTRFKVNMEVENPNPFPVEVSAFNYELYGSGRFWAEGKEKNVLLIPPRARADTKLYLVMNFIDMKRELLDQVLAKEEIRYRFAGQAAVSTGLACLPRFLTDFDLSGLSRVLE